MSKTRIEVLFFLEVLLFLLCCNSHFTLVELIGRARTGQPYQQAKNMGAMHETQGSWQMWGILNSKVKAKVARRIDDGRHVISAPHLFSFLSNNFAMIWPWKIRLLKDTLNFLLGFFSFFRLPLGYLSSALLFCCFWYLQYFLIYIFFW